LIIISTHKFL